MSPGLSLTASLKNKKDPTLFLPTTQIFLNFNYFFHKIERQIYLFTAH
ncbi:hypothetical protein ZPR_0537 [Zunongwangia profunda SM-A87]|uniref:Uncharacterized protein n=1 Tax=Zunongwangia profunda (strain DSM 18752 / CCTCC AB 206139 / SM-A87) TaxID=655815 RepID=D5BF15_ZUNPS|nr:hypothetical protein ZPR_0537 [Zunongwangia profunda SM-A87]